MVAGLSTFLGNEPRGVTRLWQSAVTAGGSVLGASQSLPGGQPEWHRLLRAGRPADPR